MTDEEHLDQRYHELCHALGFEGSNYWDIPHVAVVERARYLKECVDGGHDVSTRTPKGDPGDGEDN